MGIAAVTGSASGIGAAVRERLEADGDRVIGVDLRRVSFPGLAPSLPNRVHRHSGRALGRNGPPRHGPGRRFRSGGCHFGSTDSRTFRLARSNRPRLPGGEGAPERRRRRNLRRVDRRRLGGCRPEPCRNSHLGGQPRRPDCHQLEPPRSPGCLESLPPPRQALCAPGARRPLRPALAPGVGGRGSV